MKLTFRLAALFSGLLLAFVVIEIGLRAMGMGFGNSPMEPDAFLHHVHPRNYRFIQQHPSGELGGFEIQYNDEGRVYRGDATRPQAATGSLPCRVALMGDSFTEAGQVPYASSFAGLLEEAARDTCEVRNYGVRSYSPAIYLVQWTREVARWKPTHVFLLLFGNDVREDVTYMDSAVVDHAGMPTAISGPSDLWLVSQLRRSYTARFVRLIWMRLNWMWQFRGQQHTIVSGVVEENPDLPTLSTSLLGELKRRTQAEGARLILMVVPSRYRLMGDGQIAIEEDFHQKVKTWAAQNGVEFLDLFETFQRGSRPDIPLFFRQDIHFTAEGNALTAAIIARAFPELFRGWPGINSRSVQSAYGNQPGR
jgi:lysophospholipase L1-like esterase